MNADNLPLHAHLEELRGRLVAALVPFALAVLGGVALSSPVLAWVYRPLAMLGLPLHLFRLGDALWLRLRAGVLVGLVLAAPLLAFQMYRFARAGLSGAEAALARRSCLAFGAAFAGGAGLFMLFATPPLVRFLCASQIGMILDAEAVYSAWEGACLTMGLICGAIAILPALIRLIRRKTKTMEEESL